MEEIQEDECDCPLECDAISYSHYYVSTPFNMDEICPKKAFYINTFMMKEFYENPMPPRIIRSIKGFLDNVTSDQYELCKINSQYRAKVIFRLATDTMTVTVTSRRLSFFDKLSSFGKKII